MKNAVTTEQLLDQALYRLKRAERLVHDLREYSAQAEAGAASHGAGHDFWRGLDTGYESGFALAAKWLAESIEMDAWSVS